MRYIDADKLYPDCMTKNGTLAISQTQLANAPTVKPEKGLITNVTFDEDKLKEIVQTDVIDKIKSGELVLKSEDPQGDIFPMEIVAGKCPIEVGGNCPLKTQGEWKTGYTAKQKKVAVCNLCNCISFQGKTNFCHNCGAKMQKGGQA